jgi:outer membrane protein OmpA-like peptidoglycan-associated protein
MKGSLATICVLAGGLLASGCATKKYVRNTVTPVSAKLDQVADQTNKNSSGIEDTRNQVKQVDERATSGISAVKEQATTMANAADAHATEAGNRADKAQQSATAAQQSSDKNTQEIGGLRNVIANLDDYKLQTSVAVPFKFNAYQLDEASRQELDKVAEGVKSGRRFFIAVEGFTDRTGSKQYNEALSRRRADAVVQYLVAKHDIPIYRIHMIGLGDQKPVDEARNREARAKNRRVEVKVFSADEATAGLGKTAARSANAGVPTATALTK